MSKENPQATKLYTKTTVRAFDGKQIGNSLSEVSADYIRTEAHDIETRWFHSPQDADLFIWRDERKNIIKQQVCFYGQIAEWNILEGVRTGMVIESEPSKQMSGSQLVQFDSTPAKTTLEQGIDIVGHTMGLRHNEKRHLIDNFLTAPQLANLSALEVFARYDVDVTEEATAVGSWFKRFTEAVRFKALGFKRQKK